MDNQNIEQYKFIELDGAKLFVMRSGLIYRYVKNKRWTSMENKKNEKYGYNRLTIRTKKIYRHRIIAHAFINLDINNPKLQIDHIDGDRLNNNIDNLRIVSNQQNQWNHTKAKGYSWDKVKQKWRSHIAVNSKKNHLGYFTSEEEARQAYLDAKLKFHIIHN